MRLQIPALRGRSGPRLLTAALVVATLTGVGVLAGCGNGDGDSDSAEPLPGSRDGPLPTFSQPTQITNPLFPLSTTRNLSYVGEEEGKPLQVTVTLTGDTKDITVDGKTITAVVAEHRGTLDGQLIEVARDYYAQSDDGGVWYMGEDVDNYEGGKVADHEGAWLAGRDGARPGLLVPGNPRPGLVFYSEDIPDLDIVERDEVVAVDRTVQLPNGQTRNDAVEIKAFKEDDTTETKLYVPGIGLFEERNPEEFLRLEAVPG